MKNRQGVSIPNVVLQSGESKLSWLQNIENLSIGELIELYAYSEAIVETIREPLVILDKDLRVKTVNKSFLDTFKIAKKATYGKYIYNLNGGEWDIPELRKLLEDILPKSSFFNNFEVTHNFNKLGARTMLLNARRIVLEENKTELILLAIEDITERKKLEQQKDDFVSIISHELRTPLTSLKAFSQIVEKRLTKKGDTQNSYLMGNVIKQINTLVELTNELLTVKRVESGELQLRKRKVDLEVLIKKIVVDYQYTTENHIILSEGKIEKKVFCDAPRIEQVLTNLITNAIKYSPNSDKIILKFSIENGHVVVSVQDFGIGIAKKDQPHVFDRFYRTDKKNEQNIQGFGLGLYISNQIIRKHGGKMWVDSVQKKGSTFSFTLPVD